MTSWFDKLNLRAGERRLVVFVAVVLFIVLNAWLVWPHFGDLGRVRADLDEKRRQIAKFETEINRKRVHENRVNELRGAGATVLPADMEINLLRLVQQQAGQSGVTLLSTDVSKGGTGKPTDFFEERTVRVVVNTGDKELIDFLYKLGSGNSMIRVRDITVGPDAGQTKLAANITLVANYQKAAAKTPNLTANKK